ncbi:MAG TPA: esterase-like activity of phytase family protein [Polyangiaceae bacterium]|nr:esterase-like activity of phytase family protein [Polyangiaceae bacterium]
MRSQTSGGFEGMALSPDGKKLYPLLEKALTGAPAKQIYAHEFDAVAKSYTGARFTYELETKGESIGEFVLYTPTKGARHRARQHARRRDRLQARLPGRVGERHGQRHQDRAREP